MYTGNKQKYNIPAMYKHVKVRFVMVVFSFFFSFKLPTYLKPDELPDYTKVYLRFFALYFKTIYIIS